MAYELPIVSRYYLHFVENAPPDYSPRCSAREPPKLAQSPLAYLSHLVTPYTEAERKGLERTHWFDTRGEGYGVIQFTKPQTIGYSLADSPVGLLAWIYEKLVDWSDAYPWEDDEGMSPFVFVQRTPAKYPFVCQSSPGSRCTCSPEEAQRHRCVFTTKV